MQQKGRIIMEGMGGFLCPPTHPMLTKSVQTDLRRKPENRTCMSLEYAVDSPMLDRCHAGRRAHRASGMAEAGP